MPALIRRFCPHTFLGYSLLTMALLLAPAIAVAGKFVEAGDSRPTFFFDVSYNNDTPSFSDDDRAVLTKHLKATQRKKWDGETYTVGHYLPDHVGYKTLPSKITKKIDAMDDGYAAVRVGNEVLLISEFSRKIVDVVHR